MVADKAIRHGRHTRGIMNRGVVYTRGGLPADVLKVIEEPAPLTASASWQGRSAARWR